MKYRKGFVTNSSSSSFIIARKKNISMLEMIDILNNHFRQELDNETLSDISEYTNIPDIIKDAIDSGDIENAKNLIIAFIGKSLYNQTDIDLGDWIITSIIDASNEDEDALGFISFCCMDNIDEDTFKVFRE